MSVRSRNLFWPLVCCPAIGWVTAAAAHVGTHGRLGVAGAIALLAFLPAALAAAGTAAVGRQGITTAWVGLSAAVLCCGGFVVFVALFLLTRPPGFFE